jgi:hypothetical protein
MDSQSHATAQSASRTELLRAPAKVVRDRRGRDWLSTAWTAMFVVYAVAVLPILGIAIFQAF